MITCDTKNIRVGLIGVGIRARYGHIAALKSLRGRIEAQGLLQHELVIPHQLSWPSCG